MGAADANTPNKLTDVVGVELDSLTAESGRGMLSELQAISAHVSHLLPESGAPSVRAAPGQTGSHP